MSGHEQRDVSRNRLAERYELDGLDTVRRMFHDRQLVMRVGNGVSVSREMLAAGRDACLLQRPDDRPPEPRDILRAFGQRAIANHRVLRVGMDVEHRRVVERNPDGLELRRERARKPRRKGFVAAPSQRLHRRPHRKWRLQPGDAATFLVHAHPQRQLLRERLCFPGQLRDLIGRDHVTREEDDAAEIELASERAKIGRNRISGKPGDGELPDVTTNVAKGHVPEIIATDCTASSRLGHGQHG